MKHWIVLQHGALFGKRTSRRLDNGKKHTEVVLVLDRYGGPVLGALALVAARYSARPMSVVSRRGTEHSRSYTGPVILMRPKCAELKHRAVLLSESVFRFSAKFNTMEKGEEKGTS